jgi:hypothetical protein
MYKNGTHPYKETKKTNSFKSMKRISQFEKDTHLREIKRHKLFRQGNFVFETGGVIRLNNTTKSDPFDPVRPTSSLTKMKTLS